MTRARVLTPEELDDDQRTVYEAIAGGARGQGPQAFPLTDADGGLQGPFNAMLLQPRVGLALQQVGAALRYEGTLPGRAREIAVLAVAAACRSGFEQRSHEAVGRAVGLDDDELTALRSGSGPDLADQVEAEVLRTTRALLAGGSLATGSLTDEEYARAVGVLGEDGLFELTTLVGYYALLALQLRVFGVD